MNVLFINPLSVPMSVIETYFSKTKSFEVEHTVPTEIVAIPFGILSMASYLNGMKDGKRYDIQILDFRLYYNDIFNYSCLEEYIKALLNLKVANKPDVICISALITTSHQFTIKLCSILKCLFENITIIVGGYHATNYTEHLLLNRDIDYVCRGEGEIALSKFLSCIEDGKDPIELKGIYDYNKSKNNELALAEQIADLNDLPLMQYELLEIEKYLDRLYEGTRVKEGMLKDRKMQIMTSRGCPGRCTFCSAHTIQGRKVRFFSVERIIGEIKWFYEKYGISQFNIEDDLFTANKKRVFEMLSELKKINIEEIKLQLSSAVSVNTLDNEIIDALVDNGMTVCMLPIESGSPYVQKHIINKNVDLEKAKRLVAYMRAKGVKVEAAFILGFPNETEELINESIEYAGKLNANYFNFSIATPLLGSEMATQFIERGDVKDLSELVEKNYMAFNLRSFDTKEISAVKLNEIRYKANLICNFIENINIKEKRWTLALDTFEPLANKHEFHIICWHCIAVCYFNLDNTEAVSMIESKINNLILNNNRAKTMAQKYGYLIGIKDMIYKYDAVK